MTLNGQIRWSEGLFLQPHHFQYTQRQIEQRLQSDLKALYYPYGAIEMKVSDDQLNNHIVAFDNLRAIMPSGAIVDFPGNSVLPSLNIRDLFGSINEAITISLALPLWYSKRSNVCEGHACNVNKHYCVDRQEIYDENTGENAEIVDVLKYNARLVTNYDDTGDLELLPLLKVMRATGEDSGLPRRDKQYIPPCFSVGGSPSLNKDIRDLMNQVIASRNEAWNVLQRSNISFENLRGLQFENVWKIRTLNRYSGLFKSFLPILPKMHPFDVYLYIREMISELSVFVMDTDLADVADYNHDNLGYVFKEVSNILRSLMTGQSKSRYAKLKFELEGSANIYIAKVDKDFIDNAKDYFLCIKTSKTNKEVISIVENADKFKFMPKSIARRPIFGIRLEHENCPPPELPTPSGACFFRILIKESGMVWSKFLQERELAIHWPEMTGTDFEIHLFTIIDGEG